MPPAHVMLFVVPVWFSLSVQTITFEMVDVEASAVVWWDILTISWSNLSTKVTGSRSQSGNAHFASWTCLTCYYLSYLLIRSMS